MAFETELLQRRLTHLEARVAELEAKEKAPPVREAPIDKLKCWCGFRLNFDENRRGFCMAHGLVT
jgi:hypothetical protein